MLGEQAQLLYHKVRNKLIYIYFVKLNYEISIKAVRAIATKLHFPRRLLKMCIVFGTTKSFLFLTLAFQR